VTTQLLVDAKVFTRFEQIDIEFGEKTVSDYVSHRLSIMGTAGIGASAKMGNGGESTKLMLDY
jgi:hypothetical protein